MSGAAPIKLTKQIWINPLENQKLNTTAMYIQYGNKRGSHFRPQKVTSVDCITAEIRFSLGNPRSFVRRQLSLCNGTMEAQPGGVSPGWVFGVSPWSTGRFMFCGGLSCSGERTVNSLSVELAESMFTRIFLGKPLVCVSTLNSELQSII